jgi:ATP-binding cassette, subfamily C (CFTR/MRP), member 1
MVVGSVGSGKSSLLAAVLGELRPSASSSSSSSVLSSRIAGSVAYTQQDPWIVNATLRDNILMGDATFSPTFSSTSLPSSSSSTPFKSMPPGVDAARYAAALDACALRPDLSILPAGEATEIGEKGVNLSGGQRHRVALARACYADADVYLLDDPLSAVDAHVGRHLFDKCVLGLLGSKTRVLVTHQLQYLPAADEVLVLREGRIAERGTYAELAARGVDFHRLVGDDEGMKDSMRNEDEGKKDGKNIQVYQGGVEDVLKNSMAPLEVDLGKRGGEGTREKEERGEIFSGALVEVDLSNKDDGLFIKDKGENGRHDASSNASSSSSGIDSGNGLFITKMEAAILPQTKPSPPKNARNGTTTADEVATNEGKMTGAGKKGAAASGLLVKEEERSVGRVDTRVYLRYFQAWGPALIIPIVIVALAACERGLQTAQNWWLSVWSTAMDSDDGKSSSLSPNPPSSSFASAPAPSPFDSVDDLWYVKIYFALGGISLCIQVFKALTLVLGSLSAARRLQADLLARVLRLPMSFFDSQPAGRLLNRFTHDAEAVDVGLAGSISSLLNCTVSVFWALAVVAWVTPWVVVAAAPLAAAYLWVQKRYVATSRELKRLDSVALSPIFSHFGETLQGLATVRAFRLQPPFSRKNSALLDASNAAYWPAQCVNRWLSVRLELLGVVVVFATASLASAFSKGSAGLAGLALTSALSLTGLMNWLVRQTAEMEINMNGVERMVEYDAVEPEAPAVVPGRRPLPDWPSRVSRIFMFLSSLFFLYCSV